MKEERPFSDLIPFLPPNTFDNIYPYFQKHSIHLSLTHDRKSILGDYRRPTKEKPFHRISINATLHPYSFLITLLHELAHMFVYLNYTNRVQPHGKEWKNQFSQMLKPYIENHFFPKTIESALLKYIENPKASSCTDVELYKALYFFNTNRNKNAVLLDTLSINDCFKIDNGKKYQLIEKRRTRYLCKDLQSNKMYLFPSIYEVFLVKEV